MNSTLAMLCLLADTEHTFDFLDEGITYFILKITLLQMIAKEFEI